MNHAENKSKQPVMMGCLLLGVCKGYKPRFHYAYNIFLKFYSLQTLLRPSDLAL